MFKIFFLYFIDYWAKGFEQLEVKKNEYKSLFFAWFHKTFQATSWTNELGKLKWESGFFIWVYDKIIFFYYFSYGRKRTAVVSFLLTIIFQIIIIALIVIHDEMEGKVFFSDFMKECILIIHFDSRLFENLKYKMKNIFGS